MRWKFEKSFGKFERVCDDVNQFQQKISTIFNFSVDQIFRNFHFVEKMMSKVTQYSKSIQNRWLHVK